MLLSEAKRIMKKNGYVLSESITDDVKKQECTPVIEDLCQKVEDFFQDEVNDGGVDVESDEDCTVLAAMDLFIAYLNFSEWGRKDKKNAEELAEALGKVKVLRKWPACCQATVKYIQDTLMDIFAEQGPQDEDEEDW